jgi:hypothetical protein
MCWLAATCKLLNKRWRLRLPAWLPAPLPAGYQGLECAQLVITTAAPEPPQERLEFAVVEAAPASTPSTSQQRRRLRMEAQLSGGGSGTLTSGGPDSAAACGQPLRLKLQVPAGQQLSSVIWKDALNRTLHVQTGSSLAGGANLAGAGWATAEVELPATSEGVSGGGHYSVLVLAPDGRHARADISLESATNSGQLAVRFKYYSSRQLSYDQQALVLSWPQAHAPCPTDRVSTQEGQGQVASSVSDSSKAGGLPIAVLGAAAGGGAVLLAAIVAGCCWHCRRRRRHQQQAAGLERDSAGSGKSDGVVSVI